MKYFSVEVVNNIAVITLNREPVNALVKQCYEELKEVFADVGYQEDVRVAVLRAEGPFFCPGNDVKDFTEIITTEEVIAYGKAVSDGIAAVYNCKVPLIAAVHGHAFGAGMAIAACADVIIAADDAEFGIPEIKVGVIGAAGFLNLIVPEKVARYMSLSGEPISAQQIEKYGGIHKIVAKEDVLSASMDVAKTFLKRGPMALRYFKEAMNINQNAQLVEQYEVESSYTRQYFDTDEAKESVNAFMQKRSADYSANDN